MSDLVIPLEVLAGLALLLSVLVAAFVGRRRFLSRSIGTFDCSLRSSGSLHSGSQPMGKGWMLGLARYEADRIEWFRVFDLSMRPRRILSRAELHVKERRLPRGPEAFALMSGFLVVCCEYDGAPLELGMSEQAYTGFASWLESAPPGQNVSVA